MKQSRTRTILFWGLLSLLAISISMNGVLYTQAKTYYLQLNATRLDPPGLRAYPTPMQPGTAVKDRPIVVFYGDSRAAQWLTSPDMPGFTFINRGN